MQVSSLLRFILHHWQNNICFFSNYGRSQKIVNQLFTLINSETILYFLIFICLVLSPAYRMWGLRAFRSNGPKLGYPRPAWHAVSMQCALLPPFVEGWNILTRWWVSFWSHRFDLVCCWGVKQWYTPKQTKAHRKNMFTLATPNIFNILVGLMTL